MLSNKQIKVLYPRLKKHYFMWIWQFFLSKLTLDDQLKIISLVNQSRKIQFHNSRIPRSLKYLNSFYMKSQHSIIKNVPSPKIISYDNHACVYIEHVIYNVLSIGLPLPMIWSSDFNNLQFANSCLLKTVKTKENLMQIYKKYHNCSFSERLESWCL